MKRYGVAVVIVMAALQVAPFTSDALAHDCLRGPGDLPVIAEAFRDAVEGDSAEIVIPDPSCYLGSKQLAEGVTLADVVEDAQWRARTSEILLNLFASQIKSVPKLAERPAVPDQIYKGDVHY